MATGTTFELNTGTLPRRETAAPPALADATGPPAGQGRRPGSPDDLNDVVDRCASGAGSRCLPCMESPRDAIAFDGVLPETVTALEAEHDRLTERIDVLTRNRDAVAAYLGQLQHRAR